MADNKVIISIEAQNAEKAKQALKDLGIEAKEMGDKLKDSANGADILNKAWQALGITISAAAVVSFMKDSIEAASEQEDALVRLGNAMKIQGTYTTELAQQYKELAESLMTSTRFSDDAIENMMQRLIIVGNVGPASIERVTRATLDLAAANKIDLNSAAEIMAKSAEGVTRGLKQYGITIEEALPKAQKFEEALKQVNEKFGGSAQADINTFSGSLAQLGNSFNELKEAIGKTLIEQGNLNYVFQFWTDVLNKVTGSTGENASALEQLDNQLKKVTEESNRLGEIIATEGNIHLTYNGILMEANDALERNEAVRIRLIEQIHNQMDAEAELGAISVTKEPEEANEIVTQQQATLESLKALWTSYNDENSANQLETIQAQTEKYNFMIDTQKKANTSLWTEAGKQRDIFSKGISDMTVAWIKGDLDIKKATEAIGEAMVKSLIDFTVQWAINQALSMVFKSAEVAAATATGSAVAAAWAPAAAMTSLASFGANAAPAAAAIVSTNALAMAMAVPKAEEGALIKGSSEGSLVIAGEKGRDEAIIPLKNSNVMRQLSGQGGDRYYEINVNIQTAMLNSPSNIDEFIAMLREDIGLADEREMRRYIRM